MTTPATPVIPAVPKGLSTYLLGLTSVLGWVAAIGGPHWDFTRFATQIGAITGPGAIALMAFLRTHQAHHLATLTYNNATAANLAAPSIPSSNTINVMNTDASAAHTAPTWNPDAPTGLQDTTTTSSDASTLPVPVVPFSTELPTVTQTTASGTSTSPNLDRLRGSTIVT